jgi:hypothetical protein
LHKEFLEVGIYQRQKKKEKNSVNKFNHYY